MTSVSGQESSQGHVLPEESVMLNADLPQLLGGFVVRQLEANCALILLLLLGAERNNVTVSIVLTTLCDLKKKNILNCHLFIKCILFFHFRWKQAISDKF